MRKALISWPILTVLVLVTAQAVYAQGGAPPAVADQDLQLLRKDLRSMKKQLVAANLQLTEAEAERFWPVYDQYAAEVAKNYDARYVIIKDYADNFRNMTDSKAEGLARRWTDMDGEMVRLRQKYLPLFERVAGGKKTALFFQLDRRLALMIDLQMASEIPLAQP